MAGRLMNKVALITGTGGAQGRAAAIHFAREGAKVVGCDINAETAEETLRIVKGAGGEMISMSPVDLTDPTQTKSLVDEAVQTYGGIDILYNNAAGPRFVMFDKMTMEDWSHTIRNELDIIFVVSSPVWPHLVKRGGGCIINTASAITLRGSAGFGNSAHAAAKGGVVAVTRQLAAEGAAHKIRVNSITPGLIATPSQDSMLLDRSKLEAQMQTQMIKRFGQPEDIAHCAVYLASDESSFVTGANFVIDGGWSAW